MSRSAMEGTRLARLIRMAIPFCRKAERVCARHGPGAPPTFSDWQIAVLIMVAVMARRKSKRAQYRYLFARRKQLIEWLDLPRFPGKTTYCERYRHAFSLFQWAVTLQGRRAIAEERVDPTLVAVDKSVIRARGRPWHRRKGRPCKRKRGADPEAGWTYSKHHGWVYGYSFEVVVSASRGSAVFPLDVTAGPANRNEGQSFAPRIEQLPPETRYVAADAGYDANALAEAIEYNQQGQATKRHLLCPLQARGGKPEVGQYPHRGRRERLRRHRAKDRRFTEVPEDAGSMSVAARRSNHSTSGSSRNSNWAIASGIAVQRTMLPRSLLPCSPTKFCSDTINRTVATTGASSGSSMQCNSRTASSVSGATRPDGGYRADRCSCAHARLRGDAAPARVGALIGDAQSGAAVRVGRTTRAAGYNGWAGAWSGDPRDIRVENPHETVHCCSDCLEVYRVR